MRGNTAIIILILAWSFIGAKLRAEVIPTEEDSVRCWQYLKAGQDLIDTKVDSAEYYAGQALEIARALDSDFLLAGALDLQGLVKTENGHWKEAISLLDKSLQLREENQWYHGVGMCHMHFGNLYLAEGKMFHLSSRPDAGQSSFQTAQDHFRSAFKAFEKAEDSIFLAKAQVNLGSTFYVLYENDSAMTYLRKSLKLFEELGIADESAHILANMGIVYEEWDMRDSARYCYLKARETFMDENQLFGWVSANINMAQLNEIENTPLAIEYLQEADSLTKVLGNQGLRSSVQEYLYMLHARAEQYREALQYLENYHALKDSMLNEEFKEEELNVRYQTARKDELIEKQKAENLAKELALTKAESEKRLLFISGIALLLLAGGLTGLYFWRQRTNALIHEQKEQLYRQEMASLEQSKNLEAANAMLTGQEKERMRVARELHDQLGSTLVAARMQFDVGMDDISTENRHFEKARKLLETATREVRDIAHDLVSGVLVKLGLVPALRDLKESLEVTGRLKVELEADELPALDAETELQLFRIAQELVNNALRHANATALSIRLKQDAGRGLTFTLEDNGSGFDPGTVERGLGLQNIEQRVKALGGQLKLDSTPGEGTRVSIHLKHSDGDLENIAG